MKAVVDCQDGNAHRLGFWDQDLQSALERKQARDDLERRVEERTRELAEANRILQHEISERERGARVQSALFRIAERASTAESLDAFYESVHGIVGGLRRLTAWVRSRASRSAPPPDSAVDATPSAAPSPT